MREIKFRGKRIDNGEWVYGDLIANSAASKPLIKPMFVDCNTSTEPKFVDPSTVGQFTGLTDKNGKEIYEGDIIASEGYSQARHYIRYLEDEAMFIAMIIGSPLQEWCAIRQAWIDKFEKKVIGNIHDNPELIKQIKEK